MHKCHWKCGTIPEVALEMTEGQKAVGVADANLDAYISTCIYIFLNFSR